MIRFACGLLLGALAVGRLWAGEFSSGLEKQVSGRGGDESISALLVLEAQADIPALDRQLTHLKSSLSDRHEQVVAALQGIAHGSQQGLLKELANLRQQGKIEGYTPYWLVNGIVVRGGIASLRELAARPDVAVAEANLVVELIEPIDPGGKPLDGATRDSRSVEPGVLALNAQRVWSELGIDGSGVVVGNLDTGVDGSHPALADRYRGNDGHPASECWLDVAGNGPEPVDYNSHGTHVMGTICGGAPGDEVGVAPGAKWIASNVIAMGSGVSFDNAVLASLQFMTDPDGDPATHDDMPAVVQNSWGINESFSGYYDCDSRWWAAIDNCEAAGVVLTWSAGNEGPGSGTLRSPADRATSPYNCFSVGSTLTTAPYEISSFSSQGPSGCGGAYATKPEVCAPGSAIRSSIPGGGYGVKSGTSMAGPHVAGVVALMRSANPDLDVNSIKQILMETAVDLGEAGEDNVYGWGFVDAFAAVQVAMQDYGTLSGVVTNDASEPLAGVSVSVMGGFQTVTTGVDGGYTLMLQAMTHTVRFEAFGYIAQELTFDIAEDDQIHRDVLLAEAESTVLDGFVFSPDGGTVFGAIVEVLNAPVPSVATNADGHYALSLPAGFSYELRASAAGLGELRISLAVDGPRQQDFHLPVLPAFLPSGPDAYGYRIFDSNDAGGVPFVWNSISAVGSALSLDDDATATVSLPWPIDFYGQTRTELTISSNGFVTVGGSGATAYLNQPIPAIDAANGIVCGHWDDLNPSTSGTVYVQALEDRFVVEFDDVSYYGGGGTIGLQIHVLDPMVYPTQSGNAQWLVFYQHGVHNSETVGIESPNGTTGVQYLFNGSYDVHATRLDSPIALLFSTNVGGLSSSNDAEAPAISHVPLSDTEDQAGPWVVLADINDFSGVANATLRYRVNDDAWQSVAMSASLDVFSGSIAGPMNIGDVIDYQIIAVDGSENANQANSPVWSFRILFPAGLSYCQDFEDGLGDFSTVRYQANGSTWGISTSFPEQGHTAFIQYQTASQEDHAGLLSPVFDCRSQVFIELSFWQHLRMGYNNYWSDAFLRGSIDGGATYPYTIAEWHSNDHDGNEFLLEGVETFDISAWAAGQSAVRIQFEYQDHYDWYWHVDDFCLRGSLEPSPLDAPAASLVPLDSTRANLRWLAVPGAMVYDIYSALGWGAEFTLLATTSELNLEIPLSQGLRLFRVVARNDVGRTDRLEAVNRLRNQRPLTANELAAPR